MEQQIVNFLFSYRNTPSTVTGLSPNEMIFLIKPRTRLDLLKPEKGGNVVLRKQGDFVKPVVFSVGERVLVAKLGPYSSDKFKEGIVVKCMSAVTYLVKIDDKILYKHVNSLRKLMPNAEVRQQKCSRLARIK